MRDLIVLNHEHCLSFDFLIWLSSRTDVLYIKCFISVFRHNCSEVHVFIKI